MLDVVMKAEAKTRMERGIILALLYANLMVLAGSKNLIVVIPLINMLQIHVTTFRNLFRYLGRRLLQ